MFYVFGFEHILVVAEEPGRSQDGLLRQAGHVQESVKLDARRRRSVPYLWQDLHSRSRGQVEGRTPLSRGWGLHQSRRHRGGHGPLSSITAAPVRSDRLEKERERERT